MNPQYSGSNYINNNSTRGKDLKKSYEEINKRLRDLQAERLQVQVPLGGPNDYFLQGSDPQLSPIGFRPQTSGNTIPSLENLSVVKGLTQNGSRSNLKSDSPTYKRQSPMIQGVGSTRIGNTSRQTNSSNKESASPLGYSNNPSLLNTESGSPKKSSSPLGYSAGQIDGGSSRRGYTPLGFSGMGIGGNIKPGSPRKASDKVNVEEVKTKLKKVFQFYTTFGDRCNTSNLKSNKFHKMMIDAGVRDHFLTQKELDLLFVAENKHKSNMDYETFLQLLIKIAEQRYQGALQSREALDKFLKEHMLPLYDNLYKLSDMGIEETRLKEPITETVLIVLKSVHVLLLKLYQIYFSWEIQTSQLPNVIKQRDEVALFSLLKDFDVCPALMTKGAVTMLWTEVLDTPPHELSRNSVVESMIPFLEKDVGTLFTFSKFCALLVRIASIIYDEYLKEFEFPVGQAEKLMMLLERMDTSAGMQIFEKKTHMTHNSKVSFLVPKDILQKARSQEFDSYRNSEYSPNRQMKQVGLNLNSEESHYSNGLKRSQSNERFHAANSSVQNSKSYKNLLTMSTSRLGGDSPTLYGNNSQFDNYEFEDSEVVLTFERHNESLMRIFQYYCSYGEPMNNTRLKSIKLVKMLKECGLLTGKRTDDQSFKARKSINKSQHDETSGCLLTQTELDLIFATLTGSKHQKETLGKNLHYDPKIKSPTLGAFNHLYKNNPNTTQSSGRLSFEGFMKAIEMIAQKLLPDLDVAEAVDKIIVTYILPLDNQIMQATAEQRYMGGESLKLLVDLLKDSEIVKSSIYTKSNQFNKVDLLGIVHKSMMVYYNHYADTKGLLNFERFVQFCKDFSLFPDVISKAKIKSFFQTLAAIHSQAEATERGDQNVSITSLKKSLNQSRMSIEKKALDHPEDEVIDQHLFIEGIALCALEVPYEEPQPHNIYKICFLLERMNQSEGPMTVQKAMGLTRSPTGVSWDITFHIKQKFPEIFSPAKSEKNIRREKFDDLLGSNTADDS